METRVSSATREVTISDDQPTVFIGERINPTGRKSLTAALESGDLDPVREEALAQVEVGADILDVNVSVVGLDEVALFPEAVQAVMEAVEVPLCLDSGNPEALEAALQVYEGKPLVNSVTGEERSLKEILPLVSEYGAAVIGLTMDDDGIPDNADRRVAIAHRIVEHAEALDIPRENLILDALTLTVGADSKAGQVTVEATRRIKAELGVNMTSGASNISFGLPDRELVNCAFLAIVLAAGVNCPIVDVAKVRPTVLATDLVLGRDRYAMRYTKAYRERQRS